MGLHSGKKGVRGGQSTSLFKKGYSKQVPDDPSDIEQPPEPPQCTSPQSPQQRNYARLTRSVYELGVRGKEAPPSILRPRAEKEENQK